MLYPPLTRHYIHNPTGILSETLDKPLVICVLHRHLCAPALALVRSRSREQSLGHTRAMEVSTPRSHSREGGYTLVPVRIQTTLLRIQRLSQYPSGVIYSNTTSGGIQHLGYTLS